MRFTLITVSVYARIKNRQIWVGWGLDTKPYDTSTTTTTTTTIYRLHTQWGWQTFFSVDKKPININFYCYGQLRLTSLFAKIFRLYSHGMMFAKQIDGLSIQRGESNFREDVWCYVKIEQKKHRKKPLPSIDLKHLIDL